MPDELVEYTMATDTVCKGNSNRHQRAHTNTSTGVVSRPPTSQSPNVTTTCPVHIITLDNVPTSLWPGTRKQ